MTQHTPGPWRTLPNAVIGQWQVLSPKTKIATVSIQALEGATKLMPDCDMNAKANARLIAAAPELLAACQSLLHFAELTGWGDLALAGSGNEQRDTISIQTMELARKAVAQATGNEIPTPAVS